MASSGNLNLMMDYDLLLHYPLITHFISKDSKYLIFDFFVVGTWVTTGVS